MMLTTHYERRIVVPSPSEPKKTIFLCFWLQSKCDVTGTQLWCLPVYLSICLSVYLSIRLSVHVVFKVTVAELEIYKLSLKAPQKTEAKERVTAERASGNWLFHHCRTNGFLSAAIKLITCRCIWLINDEPLWNRPHPHPHPPSTHCHFTRQQCNYLIVDYLRFLYQHMFPVGARIAFHCDFHWIDYQLYP